MNKQQRGETLQGIWHGTLIALLAGAVTAGTGYLFHLRFGHAWFPYGGLAAGFAAGAALCLFALIRLRRDVHKNHTRALDRADAQVTFPRYALGLIRLGLAAAVAAGLGWLAWTGTEDYVLGRPLDGTVEIVLGGFVSLSIGLTVLHLLLRLIEGD